MVIGSMVPKSKTWERRLSDLASVLTSRSEHVATVAKLVEAARTPEDVDVLFNVVKAAIASDHRAARAKARKARKR